MNQKIKLRDFLFILTGIIISAVSGALCLRYSLYIKKCAVSDWLNENKENIVIHSISGKAKLTNNTIWPGTLRLIGIRDEIDKDEIIKKISYKIVTLNCPYPLVRIE